MPHSESRTNGISAAQNEPQDNTIAARRKRLARMIGRLLARTWLSQRRAAGTKGQPPGGTQEHGSS